MSKSLFSVYSNSKRSIVQSCIIARVIVLLCNSAQDNTIAEVVIMHLSIISYMKLVVGNPFGIES